MGSCAVGINWFVDQLRMIDSAPDISKLAAEVPSGAEGLYFVRYDGGDEAKRGERSEEEERREERGAKGGTKKRSANPSCRATVCVCERRE